VDTAASEKGGDRISKESKSGERLSDNGSSDDRGTGAGAGGATAAGPTGGGGAGDAQQQQKRDEQQTNTDGTTPAANTANASTATGAGAASPAGDGAASTPATGTAAAGSGHDASTAPVPFDEVTASRRSVRGATSDGVALEEKVLQLLSAQQQEAQQTRAMLQEGALKAMQDQLKRDLERKIEQMQSELESQKAQAEHSRIDKEKAFETMVKDYEAKAAAQRAALDRVAAEAKDKEKDNALEALRSEIRRLREQMEEKQINRDVSELEQQQQQAHVASDVLEQRFPWDDDGSLSGDEAESAAEDASTSDSFDANDRLLDKYLRARRRHAGTLSDGEVPPLSSDEDEVLPDAHSAALHSLSVPPPAPQHGQSPKPSAVKSRRGGRKAREADSEAVAKSDASAVSARASISASSRELSEGELSHSRAHVALGGRLHPLHGGRT
jgi:hypothetical protein